MTREEAIERIKWYFEEDDGISAEDITKEAIRMAIEALSEPSGDLISRADAIDAVWKCYMSVCDRCISGEVPTDKRDLALVDTMQTTLSALPSAEAVQGWIPVEEQPPVFPCLVCDANGNQPSVPLGIVTITDEEHGEWHIDGRLWDTKIFFKGEWCSQTGYGNRIIAWMPLPKPYREDGEA